jgi:MFS transporter, DHA1 family, inner membrane transport protein
VVESTSCENRRNGGRTYVLAYFRNNTVNLLNLHYAVNAVANTGGAAFYWVFLLKAGMTPSAVMAAVAAILLGRFIIRPAIVPLAVAVGLRPLVITGTLLGVIPFLILPYVHGIGLPLAALCATSSLADTIYWSSYHAYFAATGDTEHRGHQTSVREASSALVGIVSPVLAGWVLVTFGPKAAFGASAVVHVLAAIPLLWTPRVAVARHVPGAYRAAIPGVRLFLTDGWMASGAAFVWQIALFVCLKESYLNYGGALAIAALVAAVAGMYLGRHIDSGQGASAVLTAIGALTVVALFRAESPDHPGLAVAGNALASIASCLYVPTLMTAIYNQAKRSPCTLRFHVATEGAWDIGGATASLLAAAMLHWGVPMSVTLLLPLIGIVAAFVLLRRYYAENPLVVEPDS